MDRTKIIKYIDIITKSLDLIKQELNDLPLVNEVKDLPVDMVQRNISTCVSLAQEAMFNKKETYEHNVKDLDWIYERKKHVLHLLNQTDWMAAYDNYNIAQESIESYQKQRADSIVKMFFPQDIKDKEILDFGCGKGYVAEKLQSLGANVYGYDIQEYPEWQKIDCKFTTSCNVKNKFDIIFLYDVLDHCKDPESTLKLIKNLLKDNGKIVIRCHPWTSLHGCHLHTVGLNKAFIHLFITEKELINLNYVVPYTRVDRNPLKTYNELFNKHFKIELENKVTRNIDEFLNLGWVVDHIKQEHQVGDDFIETMKIEFVDYVLCKK